MKRIRATPPTINPVKVSVDDQLLPLSLTPYASIANAIGANRMPKKSSVGTDLRSRFGKNFIPITIAIIPIGKLIMKIQCHVTNSTR